MDESTIPSVPIEGIREKVALMEAEMRHMPQVFMEPVHHFADGLYGREITIPAGTLVVGKVHKREHLNFLMQGDITVWTESGIKRIQAPCIIKSYPGIKRVGLTHSETIWVTVHATDKTDLDDIENDLVVTTMDDYDEFLEEQKKALLGVTQ